MNDFDIWNALKKKIEESNNVPNRFPKEGEIWICSLGRNVGFEQNGSGDNFSRPILIIKKFNNHMFWGVPLSTKQKSFNFYFNFTDPNNLKVSAIIAQMRLVSIKRFKRKLYEIPQAQLLEIKQRLKSFL